MLLYGGKWGDGGGGGRVERGGVDGGGFEERKRCKI